MRNADVLRLAAQKVQRIDERFGGGSVLRPRNAAGNRQCKSGNSRQSARNHLPSPMMKGCGSGLSSEHPGWRTGRVIFRRGAAQSNRGDAPHEIKAVQERVIPAGEMILS